MSVRLSFYGRTYRYETARNGMQVVGVRQGLGGDVWIVCWIKPNGAAKKVNTPSLPAGPDPLQLQAKLDDWAKSKRLQEVTQ